MYKIAVFSWTACHSEDEVRSYLRLGSFQRKIIMAFCVLILTSVIFADEIVDFKGSNFSDNEFPKFLKTLVTKNNEKQFRKKFDIPKSKKIVWGEGKDKNLDVATAFARKNARNKAEKSNIDVAIENDKIDNENGVEKVLVSVSSQNGILPEYEFWQKIKNDDEMYYKVWSVSSY